MSSTADYNQIENYIFEQLPMFHRIGGAAYKNNLDTTNALSLICNAPEKQFPSIHVAGTNGKGSVSNMLASILQAAGYKTALFTSPHLKDYRERIRINGEMISKDFVVMFVNKYKADFEKLKPSFFEWTFALAMAYFEENSIDIAVVETGMGGRLDSTNLVNAKMSIITNIGYDHVQFLGDTLPKIATEKAGIIKPGIPVVVGRSAAETDEIFIGQALKNGCEILFADKIYSCNPMEQIVEMPFGWRFSMFREDLPLMKNVICSLGGLYQQENLQTLFASIELLNRTSFRVTEKDIQEGLGNVYKRTGFLGRWQVIGENPLIICDTGHNEDGLNAIVKQLSLVNKGVLHMVIGLVNDKEIEKMLKLLPKEAIYYFCKPNIPRGLDAEMLAKHAKIAGLSGNIFSSVLMALQKASTDAKTNDTIFVGGSTFVVAEVV